ncbi:MAG: hypothetical protein N3F09_09215 [Bacteroidia bacterium]|nr:hypothetical protein [Bacteroidia bacterium]
MILPFGCKKKDTEQFKNPFDDPSVKPPPASNEPFDPPSNSFIYIYKNVFVTTCNNSGCHDGSFEPDFRNLSSAYNSLVYAPVIQTIPFGNYQYRVKPGKSSESQLYLRLTQMPGSGAGTIGQGRMPWNDTMWMYNPTHANYIKSIKEWIDAGAKDIYGNPPVLGNKKPNVFGLQITDAGSTTAFQRPKYIQISKNNGPVDFWLYVVDDLTPPQNLTQAHIKLSLNRNDFSNAQSFPASYDANGPTFKDITLTNNVKYNFKVPNVNLNTILPDTGYIFIRAYFKDEHNSTLSETPNNGSLYFNDYYVIKITQ